MKRKFYRYPIIVCIIIAAVMLIGGWALPFVLEGADYIVKKIPCLDMNPLCLKKETWFSFYGSYFGVIATVILGFITLRFSAKLEQIHKEESYFKLVVSEIKFYDLYRDFHPSQYREDVKNRRFLISLQMDAFEPSCEISLESMEWGKDENHLKRVNDVEMQIVQKENTILKFYLDDIKADGENYSQKETFNYYYRLFAYEPLLMEFSERLRCLKLQFSIQTKRKIKDRIKDKDIIELFLFVENTGFKNDSMILGLCNTRMILA